MDDNFEDYERFLKNKEEFIKKVEEEREKTKEIVYGINDDIERNVNSFKKKLIEDSKEEVDREKNKKVPEIIKDILITVMNLILFKKDRISELFLKTSYKRLFTIYYMVSTLAGLSLFIWGKNKILYIIPYVGIVIGLGGPLIFILNTIISKAEQVFFFIFSGEEKVNAIILVNAHLLFLAIPAFYMPTLKGVIIWLIISFIFAFIIKSYVLSIAFKIKKWQSAVAMLLFLMMILGLYIIIQLIKTQSVNIFK